MNQDFSRYDQAGAAKLTFDLLNDHFNNVQGRMDFELFSKLDKGLVVTPEEAIQFILMKHANHKLLKTLEQKITAGKSAGARIQPLLTGAHNNA